MILRLFLTLMLCTLTSPLFATNLENICAIIQDHPQWQQFAQNTEAKTGVPIAVQFAIMHQESHFKANAKNPHSTARGYAQALNKIWQSFQETQNDHSLKRSDFNAASQFIGWYAHKMQKQLHIEPSNAYHLYLAYHDGAGGYKHDQRVKHNPTRKLARHVQQLANNYQQQLVSQC